jgi:Zn-dependent protease with chaperone function
MMFLIRGLVVSLGIFFLIYATASVLLAALWRMGLNKKLNNCGPNLLFALRMLPLVIACTFVCFFTIPSFLFLEPKSANEATGWFASALACGGEVVLIIGSCNAFLAWWKASRFVSAVTATSEPLDASADVPVFKTSGRSPALIVAGVHRPALLVSERALEVLEEPEMRAAIDHELAHVRSRDNLKKLLLHTCAFPFLYSVDRAWLQAAEIAADDRAALNEKSAVDLASALLKIARLGFRTKMPDLAMSLVPSGNSLETRVARLLAWQPRAQLSAQRSSVPAAFYSFAALALVLASYSWSLAQMHELTELLIR